MNEFLSNKKILIAEDEPAMLNALVDKFKREGCVVVPAENGEAAFNLAIRESPDVILLDILMPRMSGMEVMTKLRGESEWGRKVPIIVLTNVSPDATIMSGVTADEPSYYLIKSDWKLYEVVEKVENCIKNPPH